jgi:hypothetical protein
MRPFHQPELVLGAPTSSSGSACSKMRRFLHPSGSTGTGVVDSSSEADHICTGSSLSASCTHANRFRVCQNGWCTVVPLLDPVSQEWPFKVLRRFSKFCLNSSWVIDPRPCLWTSYNLTLVGPLWSQLLQHFKAILLGPLPSRQMQSPLGPLLLQTRLGGEGGPVAALMPAKKSLEPAQAEIRESCTIYPLCS